MDFFFWDRANVENEMEVYFGILLTSEKEQKLI